MKKGFIYIVLTALIFSTMEISGKMVAGQLNSYQVTFLRFLIGTLILLPFAVKEMNKRKLKLSKKDIVYFTFTGIICVPISMALLQVAVEYTKQASITAVIFCTNPIFTIPFSYFILKDKISKRMYYSMALCIVGILFIFNPFKMNFNIRVIEGMFIALASAVSFSLYTVVSKKKLGVYGGHVFNFFTFLMGDIVLLIILLINRMPVIKGITYSNIFTLIYMGVVVTGLGYIVFLTAIEETSAVTASTAFFIKPALAPILSLIILKESITLNVALGIALIIVGSLINTKKDEKLKLA